MYIRLTVCDSLGIFIQLGAPKNDLDLTIGLKVHIIEVKKKDFVTIS